MVAAAGKVLQQSFDVIGRIGVGRAGWIGAIDDAVVAVLAPSVETRGIVVAGLLSVAQIPPCDGVELSVHRGANAIGKEETVHQAGGLLAGTG
jgi:hypothetical protein